MKTDHDYDEMRKDMQAYNSISSLHRLLLRFRLAKWFSPMPATMQGYMIRHRRATKKTV